MIEELRRLATARPFEPFVIYMDKDCKAEVNAPEEICFTRLGVPKVRVEQDGKPIGWLLINVDYILGIRISEVTHSLEKEAIQSESEAKSLKTEAKLQEIRSMLDNEPFRPFAMHLVSGDDYAVMNRADLEIIDSDVRYRPWGEASHLISVAFIRSIKPL